MIQKNPILDFFSHLILILGVLIVFFPIYVTFIGSTQTAAQIMTSNPISLLPGNNFIESYRLALFGGKTEAGASIGAAGPMMLISLSSALIIAIGKIAISLLSAFAIVYFRFPFKNLVFWMVFVTLMLPVEVRIFPTFKVVSDLSMLDTCLLYTSDAADE